MFFIRAGAVLAWLLFGFGALRVIIALIIAFQFDTTESMIAASKRYLGTENTGEAIDKGLPILAAGIVVGLLVEIAKKRMP